MLTSQITAAFSTEVGYRPLDGPVTLINERLTAITVPATEVASHLTAEDAMSDVPPPSEPADMVIGREGLRHAFSPRAALDSLCEQVRPEGRLIYAQRLVDHYLGLTPKWFLDYFIGSLFADCRIYLLWPPDDAPAVATFDYEWMLAKAGPIYNPMWDNITHAEAVLVVAEKAANSRPGQVSQDNYRPREEWDQYTQTLRRLAASSRPWHITGPVPGIIPAGYRPVKQPTQRMRTSII